jgi:hypothetical protein
MLTDSLPLQDFWPGIAHAVAFLRNIRIIMIDTGLDDSLRVWTIDYVRADYNWVQACGMNNSSLFLVSRFGTSTVSLKPWFTYYWVNNIYR